MINMDKTWINMGKSFGMVYKFQSSSLGFLLFHTKGSKQKMDNILYSVLNGFNKLRITVYPLKAPTYQQVIKLFHITTSYTKAH